MRLFEAVQFQPYLVYLIGSTSNDYIVNVKEGQDLVLYVTTRLVEGWLEAWWRERFRKVLLPKKWKFLQPVEGAPKLQNGCESLVTGGLAHVDLVGQVGVYERVDYVILRELKVEVSSYRHEASERSACKC